MQPINRTRCSLLVVFAILFGLVASLVEIDVTFAAGITLTPSLSTQGNATTVTVTGSAFRGGRSATVSFDGVGVATCSTAGNGTVNSGCTFSVAASTAAGSHTVTFDESGTGGRSASTTFMVNPRLTTTSVSCAPGSIAVNGTTTCTATVTDNPANGGTSSVPDGAMAWSVSGGTGTFSNAGSCTLAGGSNPTSCSVTYTATTFGTASHTISASYTPTDSIHFTSSGSASVSIDKLAASISVNAVTGVFGGSAGLSATFSGSAGVSGKSISFKVNGASVGSATTDSNGMASLSNASLSGINAGTYSGGVVASFGGDSSYNSGSASNALTVNSASTTTQVNNATLNFGTSSVSLTANISANAPSSAVPAGGTVTFTIKDVNSNVVGSPTASNPVSGGAASVIYALPAGTLTGSYSIVADYSGSGEATPNFSGSSGTGALTIGASATTTTVSSATAAYGDNSITFNASVTSPAATVNGGTITFTLKQNTTTLGTATSGPVSNGATSVSYALPAGTAPGSYTIQAAYSGSANFAASNGQNALTLNTASLNLSVDPVIAVYQGPVILVATLKAGSSGISGKSLSFSVNGVAVGSATTGSNGVATLNLASLPASINASATTYTLAATFAGDTNYNNASGNSTIKVNGRSTATGVSCSPTSGPVNGSISCTATITDSDSGTASTPSGTVAWSRNGSASSEFGTSVCTAGPTGTSLCTVTFTPSSAGTPSITASYSGDTNHLTSSGSATITVSPTDTALTVGSASFAYSTSSASLSATLSSGSANLGGKTIHFSVNGAAVGSATTGSNGVATLNGVNLAGLNAGTYPITADFAGDADYNASAASGTLTITQANVSVSVSSASMTYGDGNVSLKATMSASSAVNAGTVTFVVKQGGSTLGSATDGMVSNGSATLSYALPAGTGAGNYSIEATYNGSANFAGNAGSNTLAVEKKTLTVTADPQSRVYGTANPTFSVTYSGFVNGENASALGGGLDCATTATASSNTGAYPISCATSSLSSSNYTFNYVDGTLTITPANSSVSLANAAATVGDSSVTLNATVASSRGAVNAGTVTFAVKSGQTVIGSAVDGTVNNGAASVNYSLPAGLAANSYTIEAIYNGSLNFTGSGPATANLVIGKATTALAVAPETGSYGAVSTLSATLTADNNGLDNKIIKFTLSGVAVGTATTNSSGVASLDNVSLAGLNTGNYSGGIGATFDGDNDYFSSAATNGLTVTSASAGVAVASASATYGEGSVTLSATITSAGGTVNGGTVTFTVKQNGNVAGTTTVSSTVSNDAVSVSYNLPTGTGAGAYIIEAEYSGSSNFTSANGTASFTINPASLTVTAADKSKTYGEANPNFSVTYSGFVNGENESVLGGTLAFSTIATESSDAGTYPIMPSGLSSGNYAINYVNGTLTVAKAPLTVTANDSSKVYGEANPTFSVNYNGFVLGQDEKVLNDSLSFSTLADVNSPVGAYAVMPGGLTSGNYAISFEPGTLTVTPKALTITADNRTKFYGEVNPNLTASYSGFVAGDSPVSLNGMPSCATSAGVNSPVGDYRIDCFGQSSNNYTITYVPGTLSIVPANTTVTGVNTSITFGDSSVTLHATVTANVPSTAIVSEGSVSFTATKNGNTIGSSVSGDVIGGAASATFTIPAGTLADDYTVEANYIPAAIAPNFNASSDANALLSIGKAPQTISFGPLSDKTYGDTAFAVSATASSNLTVSFSATGNCSVSDNLITITGAGSCAITASQSGNGNYSAAPNVTQSFNVAKATPSVTWANPSNISYGTALSATQLNATASAVIEGNPIAVSGNFLYTPPSGTVLNAGNGQLLSVVFTPDDATNFNGASANVVINVAKADQIITFDPLNPKTYGDAPFTVSASASSNLAISFAVDGNCSINGNTITITGAGSCTVTASQSGDSNFNPASAVSQTFSINKATALLNLSGLSQTYNGLPRTATVTTVPDGLSGISITYDGSATAPTNAGSYSVVASLANENYQATDATGTLTIGKAGQTISFGPLTDKNYTDPAFELNATATSGLNVVFAASGPCSVAGNIVTLTGAGNCTLTASQAGDDNYNPAPDVAQTFTIGKAIATVTLGTLDFTYDGTPKPVNATTIPGGLNVKITYNGSPTAPTDAGSYQVMATVNDANYSGSASSTLVISKATINITWANPSDITYGTALSAAQLNATTTVSGSFAYTPSSGTVLNAGDSQTLSVLFTPDDTANFNSARASVNLNVKRVELTITANSQTRQYNSPNPAFDATYSGFVNGDTASSLMGTLSCSTTALQSSPPGNYPVNCSGQSSSNYNLTYVAGTLTILPDVTAPTTTFVTSPQPNLAGWFRSNVTVTFNATDAGGASVKELVYSANGAQPIASTTVSGDTASFTITAEGITTVSFFARDNANNAETVQTITVRIDKTAPVVTSAVPDRQPDNNGWYNQPVTFNFSGTDGLSGIAACAPVSYSGPDTVTATVSGSCTDIAGNSGAKSFGGFNYDGSAPVTLAQISQSQPPAGSDGWYPYSVNVMLFASDTTSGVKQLIYSATGAQTIAPRTVNGSYAEVNITKNGITTLSYQTMDKAGNLEPLQTLTIKVDTTRPVISAGVSPEPNGAGWRNRNVIVTLTATDEDSGVKQITYRLNNGPKTTINGSLALVPVLAEGTATLTYYATDKVGNVGPEKSLTVKLDKTGPVIKLTAPANGATYKVGQTVKASYSCSDSLSGVASCAGTVASNAKLDTATPGLKTFTVTATDRAGNVTTQTVTYTVKP